MKKSSTSLGRSLVKDKHRRNRAQVLTPTQFASQQAEKVTILAPDAPVPRKNLGSVTHISDLEELVSSAALAGRSFTVERQNAVVLTRTALAIPPKASPHSAIAERAASETLRIPRRPAWSPSTSATDLDRLERESFLSCRRDLAAAEESGNLLLTPFEKFVLQFPFHLQSSPSSFTDSFPFPNFPFLSGLAGVVFLPYRIEL